MNPVLRRSVLTLTALTAACGGHTPRPSLADAPPGAQLIPTRYFADRFFATPVTTGGDTVSLFLDTGGGTLAWEADARRLGWSIDSVKQSNGAWRGVASLPEFRADRSVPPTRAASLQGTRLVLLAGQPGSFGQMIAQSSQGQLGQLWFDERIWTFDYPRHRLLLHASPPARDARAHAAELEFFTDSSGKRVGHDPRVDVVVDGASLKLLLDTGATVWLTDDARARLGDAQPAERAISHVRESIFHAWRARHSDWLVIPNGDRVSHADLIRVPVVRIAGFDVGPVWFDALPETPGAAPPPARNRVDGTLGGSALKFFELTVDYPHALALFVKGNAR